MRMLEGLMCLLVLVVVGLTESMKCMSDGVMLVGDDHGHADSVNQVLS